MRQPLVQSVFIALLAFALQPLASHPAFAAAADVTVSPGSGGSVVLQDSSGTPQLSVGSGGVLLPGVGTGTAAHNLCVDSVNKIITCSAAASPTLAFDQNPAAIAFYPPLAVEVTVASLSTSVQAGDHVKLDGVVNFAVVATASASYTIEARLYRDGLLIITARRQSNMSAAGTFDELVPISWVDTAPGSTTSFYQLRLIVTSATNITSASTLSSSLNAIVFP